MQVQPLVSQGSPPPRFDHRVAERDLDQCEDAAQHSCLHQLIHLPVDVLHARIGDNRRYAADLFAGFCENLAGRDRIKPFCEPPGEDPTGEIVDDGVQINLHASDEANHRYGHAGEIIERRRRVLEATYRAKPERFVRGIPHPPALPGAVWINPPERDPIGKTTGAAAENGAHISRVSRVLDGSKGTDIPGNDGASPFAAVFGASAHGFSHTKFEEVGVSNC